MSYGRIALGDSDQLAEVALGIIVLYVLITLLFTTLLFIAGRLQARSKTAIDRLTVIVEQLTDHTSAMARPAISDEFRTVVDRLTAELKQLRERSADNPERALRSAEIGGTCTPAIEQLMVKIDHLINDRIGMPQQLAEELKAAIHVLNSRVEHLTTIAQRIPESDRGKLRLDRTQRSVTFDTKTQQDLRDLLKEFE